MADYCRVIEQPKAAGAHRVWGLIFRKKLHSNCAFTVAAMALLMAGNATAREDEPTIAKDSIQVTAYTFNVFHKSYDIWSWAPSIEFRVNGPIASGGQLYAEFALPGGPPVKFDCKTEQVLKGSSW